MSDLKPCPFGADHKVWIGVHDDEGNYHGAIGCGYESDPWSGLSYGLHHEGWGDCPLCTDGEGDCMGGMLFDTPEDATEAWNTRHERTCKRIVKGTKAGGWPKEVCSKCGAGIGDDRYVYCWRCGAKVVAQ